MGTCSFTEKVIQTANDKSKIMSVMHSCVVENWGLSWLWGLLIFSPSTEHRWEWGVRGGAGAQQTGQVCLGGNPEAGWSGGISGRGELEQRPFLKPLPGGLEFKLTGSYWPHKTFLVGFWELGWKAQPRAKRCGWPVCIPVPWKVKHSCKRWNLH